MNDCDQWTYYGMFACLMDECEDDHGFACLMCTEADGEGMLEEFEDGEEEMYEWLAYKYNPGNRNKSIKRRYPPLALHRGNPHTLH